MRMTCAVVAMIAFVLAGCRDDGPALRIGDSMRSFRAQTLTDERMELPDAAIGKVLVLFFWASWCRSCNNEMRAIEAIWKDHRDRGLLVLAVNSGQCARQVASFVKEMVVTYPVLLDPGSEISRAYHVTGLPMTFVIDRQGRVHGRILGEANEATFRKMVESLL